MKLGIIGSGLIVQEFLPRLIELDGVEVIGILSTLRSIEDAEKLCEENNVKIATTDFDELCNAGIDTVYVAVPNFLHFDYCKRALEKNLNVICEKPMTSNESEAVELQKLAKDRQKFFFEAITTLYLGAFQKIREWLPKIGDIKLVRSEYSQYSRRYNAFRAGEVLPAFDPKKSGGTLMDLNLYNMHLVMGLFGEPIGAEYFANIERDIDTSGVLVLKYENFVATCIAAKDSKGSQESLIQGTDGHIHIERSANLLGGVTLELNNGTFEYYNDHGDENRLEPEFKTFIDAINRNDLEFCYKQLEKSVAVCRIQTAVRKKAGIKFAADE